MRLINAFLLALCLAVLALCLGNLPGAHAELIRHSPRAEGQPLVEAKYVCGWSEGSFSCRSESGDVSRGKNATPGISNRGSSSGSSTDSSGQEMAPPPAAGDAGQGASSGAPAQSYGACPRGTEGTPPNCHCPKNSELLGGNCVHYTATCRSPIPAATLPQPCQGAEEKLVCRPRQDGMQDCCCLTYDRF